MSDARRAGIVALLVLLAGGAVLHASRMGSIRFDGVGLIWWYAAVVAPGLAGLITTLALAGSGAPRAGVGAIAPWVGPAVVTTLTAQTFAGAGAPALALAASGAPLLALLGGSPARDEDAGLVARALTALALGLVLCAQFIALADVGRVLGVARWPMVLAVTAMTPFATLVKRARWTRTPALIGGTLAPPPGFAAVGVWDGSSPSSDLPRALPRPLL